ncbi:MAG: hypothetical protein Roseis2KO_33540 [Roseivirga sp.]
MIYNGQEIEFPAIMQVSFFKLIETLELQVNGEDQAAAAYAQALLAEVDQYPELRDGIADISQLQQYDKSIKMLSRALFPDALTSNEIKILTPPFYFEPMYTSTRFDNIVKASGDDFAFTMKDVDEDMFYLYCCFYILGHYYHFPLTGGTSQFLEFFNQDQGLTRTYKMLINADMSEFIPTDKAVDITQQDFEELMNNFGDMDLWKSKFPPNSWIMRGLNLVSMVDVTFDQSLGNITSNLLIKSTDTFDKIQQGIRNLLGNNELSIGVLSLENDRLLPKNQEGLSSILLSSGESLDCKTDLCDYSMGQLIARKEPLIITDADYFDRQGSTGLSRKLLESGYSSYIIMPIVHEGEFLGYMELAARKRYELHKGSLKPLNTVMPILAMAHKRFITEAQNLIEAVIQQECTTIHSSVKWRFEEEAAKFIEQQARGEQPDFTDIAFDNLYPLYGQMDIKGSSERRNKAVSADLIKQLNSVNKVLRIALEETSMPVYEELLFRTEAFIQDLKSELSAGTEHKLLAFLNANVYPVFEHLKSANERTRPLIAEYEALIHPEMKTVYEERKKYDLTVNQINQRLASYLDSRQVEAQSVFPHYFERYKTDGVEYNIYIGQSITKEKTFDPVYLRNIRLWQLLVMCEMENKFRSMQKELNTSIEMASLILVYNTSISVQFRMDEKQFDVEGAYNARYEIIKKRVDKAHIKGTKERITQPGHIVIVYSQEQDAAEYRTYLNFLIAKGHIKKGYKDYVLEDLQGVHGLHALRAEVAYDGGVTYDELIQEIEGSATDQTP